MYSLPRNKLAENPGGRLFATGIVLLRDPNQRSVVRHVGGRSYTARELLGQAAGDLASVPCLHEKGLGQAVEADQLAVEVDYLGHVVMSGLNCSL